MDAKNLANARNAKKAKIAGQPLEGEQAHEEVQLPAEELSEEELDEISGGTTVISTIAQSVLSAVLSASGSPSPPSPPTTK